ncbi:MAG: septal ring lytic transglycosylase RlpA family protein [Gammaproteobacteria bacterium]|nr:MAG: septal ring lytic transglycosylase RlpA family protein [Gammaproteobacteria bacterium]
MTTHHLALALIPLFLLLAGCGGLDKDGAPRGYPDLSHTPDAIPRAEPYRRINMRSYRVNGRTYHPLRTARGYVERGIASWYGTKFHGRNTASGEPYDMYAMTAAHRTLPLPSYVRVTNLENGRSTIVRVNDRGPFHPNRVIDLSYAAASKLGMLGKGTALVEVRAIDPSHPASGSHGKRQRTDARPPHAPRIYIQVGAFGNADNARRLATRLQQALQRPVRIERASRPGGTIVHRVRVGPLASVEIADRVTDTLHDLQIEDTRILIR